MKRKFFLILLAIMGTASVSLIKNNQANACDKKCQAAYVVSAKTILKDMSTENEEVQYSYDACPCEFPFVSL